MIIKTVIISVILSAFVTAASCSSPTAGKPPFSSPAVQPDKPVQIENTGLTGSPAGTAISPPVNQYSNPGPSSNWQVCTWNLYGIFTTTEIHAGKPLTIGAYLYIEDFPTTDVDTELLVNNVTVARQTVSVNFDEAWPFYFPFVPDKPGDYNFCIKAILDVNAAFANLPGGGDGYYNVSTMINVPG
jgi:hypothetical protein